MHDLSDEATGLPPLDEVNPESSFLVGEYLTGNEGIITLGDQDIEVSYFSIRGVIYDDEGIGQYAQQHIAIPSVDLRSILKGWLESLGDTPPESPA